jgi:hypothetical protein
MCRTYTWFSPLGEKIQAATHMAATTARPMKMLQLEDGAKLATWGV